MAHAPVDFPADALADVCRRYQVRELAIFGSAARGEAGPQSDLDMLVEFEPKARIGFLALAALGRELSALVGRRVDVVPKGGLKPLIRDEVLREAEVVFAA
ncbi:MAG: nucleotidyltransferase family protein [Planctomycetes bacterium]|nr:nucleotidyltransferase family protein [Planctomycetota bacterium]